MGNERRQKELRRQRRKERAANRTPKPRECGGCVACCTAGAAPEVESLAGEHCQHECAAGCAIYETRPSRCAGYRCVWLDGWGSKADDRPDGLGWVATVEVYPQFNAVAGGESTKGSIIVVREAVPGATRSARFAQALRDWMGRGSAVLVNVGDGVTLYGPRVPNGAHMSRGELESLSGTAIPPTPLDPGGSVQVESPPGR